MLLDLEIPRIERLVIRNLVGGEVPLIYVRSAVLKFLGEMNYILRRQGQAFGRLEIAKKFFDGVARLLLPGALGDVGTRRVRRLEILRSG